MRMVDCQRRARACSAELTWLTESGAGCAGSALGEQEQTDRLAGAMRTNAMKRDKANKTAADMRAKYRNR